MWHVREKEILFKSHHHKSALANLIQKHKHCQNDYWPIREQDLSLSFNSYNTNVRTMLLDCTFDLWCIQDQNCCMVNFFSSSSSIYYPYWQTAWCGCGTGSADAAVETCPGICSSTKVFQIPFYWSQPCWIPLKSPPITKCFSGTENKSSWIWYQCR